VHRALQQQGFTQVSNVPARIIRYSGALHCSGVDVPVHLDITDKEFTVLPIITLIDRPSSLPAVCSHLGDNNVLCYASSKIAHIDIHRAPGQLLDCISKAESVLSRLLAGDPLADTRDEFTAYWRGDPILVDLAATRRTATAWKIKFNNGREHWILGADESAVKAKYEHTGGTLLSEGAPVFILDSTIPPSVSTERWPPKTCGDIAVWLNKGDKATLKALGETLKDFHRLRKNRVLIVVRNEWAWFGFSVTFDRALRSKHTSAKDWVHYVLWGRGAQTSITRLQPVRIDQPYLISRNLSGEQSLENKRIILAGCGAIGGYLAEMLIRAGAGSGVGRLILVDPDCLVPGNLGRHVLGVQDLFRNKAEAVRDWVCSHFPSAAVVAISEDVRNVSFKNANLLINATGEEALSNALNLRYLAGKLPPVLYSWIKGPGTAAQALLVDSPTQGCFRCLRTADGTDRYSPLLKPIDSAVMGHGCDDYYVPFSAAASMQAAALAGQLVLDWVNDRATPRLRTRAISYNNLREIKDKDLTRVSDCPACGG
jgi:hypothetical protein